MSLDDNTALARAYFTASRDRDQDWWQRFIAPDFVRPDPGLDFAVRGPDGVAKLGEVMHGGFTQVELPIDEVIGEGDRVLVRLCQKGVHTGEFQGVAATGRLIGIEVMDYFPIRDGQVAEHWALMDNLSLLKQIGAVAA